MPIQVRSKMLRSLAVGALVVVAMGAMAPVQAQGSPHELILPRKAVNTQASYSAFGAGYNRRLSIGAGTTIQENSRVDSGSVQIQTSRTTLGGGGFIGVNGMNPMEVYAEMLRQRAAARAQYRKQVGRDPHNTVYGAARHSEFVHPRWQDAPRAQSTAKTEQQAQNSSTQQQTTQQQSHLARVAQTKAKGVSKSTDSVAL
jgi:hypothetical protein